MNSLYAHSHSTQHCGNCRVDSNQILLKIFKQFNWHLVQTGLGLNSNAFSEADWPKKVKANKESNLQYVFLLLWTFYVKYLMKTL